MVRVYLSSRTSVPRWLSVTTQIATVVAALAVGGIALAFTGVDPFQAYSILFIDTLTTPYTITNTIVRAVPLVLAGYAVFLPLKAGLENIGAEGQIYLGGILGTWVGLNLGLPSPILLPVMVLSGLLGGALWALVPAFLRAKWNVNEILTTLMSVFIAIQVNEYLINGPMQGGAGAFPRSESLPTGALLPTIPGTGFHVGVLFLVVVPVLLHLLLNRTRLGYEITMTGSNPEAAGQAGMSKFKIYVIVLTLGAAFAGLAGMVEIAANQQRLTSQWSPGYGWTAIPIALLGRRGAFQTALAGFFFAILIVGSLQMQSALSVSAALASVIEALVILFLITAEFVRSYEVYVETERNFGRDLPFVNVVGKES
ncbi:ABC transporter permease [Halobellus ordinarius]|uniref:ABC transporter permease n=1 Tax=Halobellus ordinarius TaxID=3075120 RepID=UPI002880468B|nr:ABC transporter permease [Halobellus sp. ZY16]